jgi:hypothetical protein
VANVVPAVLHQEALAQELWLATIYGDFVDDCWHFTNDMEQAKAAGLLKATLCLK